MPSESTFGRGADHLVQMRLNALIIDLNLHPPQHRHAGGGGPNFRFHGWLHRVDLRDFVFPLLSTTRIELKSHTQKMTCVIDHHDCNRMGVLVLSSNRKDKIRIWTPQPMRNLLWYLIRLNRHVRRRLTLSSPISSYMYDLENAGDFANPFIHEEMLSSPERIEPYYDGIQRTVKKGDVVVDIGAGTGILSFFAARFADTVYAVEHSPIIEKAKKVSADNKIDNVQFAQCNSRDFKLEKRADVIIHEQMGGANPFSENMIENLIDARRRLLKPGGRILPNRFEIFLEPVQLKEPYRIPFLWEFDIKSISYRSLRPEPQSLPAQGTAITHYHCRHLPRDAFERFLCNPKPIMRFDLETLNEGDLPHRVHYENMAIRDGLVDGLWIYFKARFDDEVSIDTSPDRPFPFNPWVQMIYRIEKDFVKQGDVLKYDLDIKSILDDHTWALTWHGSKNRA